MGKRRYKKRKHMREDYESIQSAGKKRGLWGSIGATLLGGLAMIATGGVAAPVVAGMMAAGGSFAGGHIGNWLAGKTKGGKLTGTKWYQSLGKDLGSQIKEGINVRALKSGLQATLMAGGGKIGSKVLGKGGTTVTAQTTGVTGTNKLGGYAEGLFKGGERVHEYSDSLFGKLGKTIDFKGSVIGSKVGTMMHEGGWTGKDLTDWAEAQGPPSDLRYPSGGAQGPPELMSSPSSARGQMAPGEITSQVEKGIERKRVGDIRSQYTDVIRGEAGMNQGAPDLAPIENMDYSLSIDEASLSGRGNYVDPTDTPFDRSSMQRRQATARYQGGASPTPSIVEPFSEGGGEGFTQTSAWEQYTEPWTGYRPNEGYRPTWAPGGDVETAKVKAKWHNKLFGD